MTPLAIPLIAVATGMTLTVPGVIEYFRNQKGIDLSGYGENDLVPLEVLFPERYKKEYKTWEGSYYKPEAVIGDTSLEGTILKTKKDDGDEVIDVTEEDLEKLPRQDVGPPDPEKDPNRWLKELANISLDVILRELENKAERWSQEQLVQMAKEYKKRTKLTTKHAGLGYYEATIDGKTFGISNQNIYKEHPKDYWNITFEDRIIDSVNTLKEAKEWIEDNHGEFKNIIKFREEYDIEKRKKTEAKGLVFPKEKTANNLRLHTMRLKNILDGKAEAYPGGPKNERIVLQPPEGSGLPPIAIGNITFQDWEDKIIGNQETILEDANWYAKVFDSFDVMTNGDKKRNEILAKAWLAGQINLSPVNALANVIYIHEQWKRGVPFEDVKGKGLPVAVNNVKSIIYGEKMEGGAGPKISDFIDSGYGNITRSIMGHNSEGGHPFVVDIHTARDTGLIDSAYLNHLKKLGYIIPEGIEIDFGQGGITGTRYENRALFGQDLTRYLNDKNWMGKNDWTPSQIQAIGWMNLTRMYGESGDIDMALNRNLRRIAMEVDPGEGSPWQLTYGEKYNALSDEKKFKINELVTVKAIDFVNQLTGIDFSGNVHGTGGWELIQNPSTVQETYASQEAAEEAASLLGLFNNQTEILVSSTKELTKNPQHYSLFIIEDGSTNLRDSNTLKGLFERIINNDPAGLFRGYQPIMVKGQPGIQIIIDKDTISKAIAEKRIKKADILPYIQEFSENGLTNATKDLDFAVKNYISEANVKKIVNDWTKQKNGQSFIDNISEKFKSIAEDTGRSTIDYFREQLTKYLAELLQQESKTIEKITDETVKKLTKKKYGGLIDVPKFHFGSFIDVHRI
jgi:hypothetical protein